MQKLTRTERAEALPGLTANGWTHDPARDSLTKAFKFGSFTQAFAWMTACAITAEKMNHHPEWFNVYNRVTVTLTTHEAEGLTERDVSLAQAMDRFAGQVPNP